MRSLNIAEKTTGEGMVPILVKVQQLQRLLLTRKQIFERAWKWVDAFLQ